MKMLLRKHKERVQKKFVLPQKNPPKREGQNNTGNQDVQILEGEVQLANSELESISHRHPGEANKT